MAINWRQREPILRVLAAVYAELGEDTFKGRYDRIARLYGNDASYSAIKSFFAKDVVKLAEDMKARIANQRQEWTPNPNGRQASLIRRPIHITFDDLDDEVVIVSERTADSEVRNARSKINLDQGKTLLVSYHDERNRTSRARDSMDIDVPNSAGLPLETPESSSNVEKGKQKCGTGMMRPVQRRKRPHSAVEESDNPPLSFGYVTDQGRHRCALCMTELRSADMLKKHESLSELHLTNLQDPTTVFRGQMILAEHNSISDQTYRKQSRLTPAHSNTATSSRRDEGTRSRDAGRLEHSNTSLRHQESNQLGNETHAVLDTVQIAEPNRLQLEVFPWNIDSTLDNNEATNGADPDIEIVEASTKGKAKEPAQTILNDAPATLETQSRPQPQYSALMQQEGYFTDMFPHSRDVSQPDHLPPTWIAHTLLSSGMELLAKKCIEEHPELKAGFYKCIQEMQTISKATVSETGHETTNNRAEGEEGAREKAQTAIVCSL